MDAVICTDGNRLLPDLERKSSSEEAITHTVFCSAFLECSLVASIFWDGIPDSWIGNYSANVDSNPDLYHPIQKSFQACFWIDDTISALGIICYHFEFLDLVLELEDTN